MGSGYAGSYLAGRLASRECGRRRVLLLESGGMPPFDTAIPFSNRAGDKRNSEWDYFTVPQRNAGKAMRDRVSDQILVRKPFIHYLSTYLHLKILSKYDHKGIKEVDNVQP